MSRNTGLGIPKEMLPRIFEMFTQVNRSLERSQGGLGIGLALVQNLAHMHGGSIERKAAVSARAASSPCVYPSRRASRA